jgi:hypothetical protein
MPGCFTLAHLQALVSLLGKPLRAEHFAWGASRATAVPLCRSGSGIWSIDGAVHLLPPAATSGRATGAGPC